MMRNYFPVLCKTMSVNNNNHGHHLVHITKQIVPLRVLCWWLRDNLGYESAVLFQLGSKQLSSPCVSAVWRSPVSQYWHQSHLRYTYTLPYLPHYKRL